MRIGDQNNIVYHLEAGERLPLIRTMLRLSEALGVGIDYLLGNEKGLDTSGKT